ncbi:MAG: hydrogenase maturation protein [Burkholderiales bacterium]|jgi:putative two-component system hydrogenase maturation factor HypX/HoxX|nr:hydrogenase maturation protein [Burkholderiales bacterium]
MRILFLTHSFNSLTQRLYVELCARGHDVTIEFDVNDSVSEEAVRLARPDLVIAPFLKRAIPASIWRSVRCLVVHPGIKGDRGPSALDWAIQEGEREWGVTVLEATGEMDGGDVWASHTFPMRAASKGSLYRSEVTEAAVRGMLEALDRMRDASFRPEPLDYAKPDVRGRLRPLMKQADRAIDWVRDASATVLAKLRAADGFPGVRDHVLGEDVYLYDAHPEDGIRGGMAGEVIAKRNGAILRATADGAVWIGHLKRAGDDAAFKLPATMLLGARLAHVPEIESPRDAGCATYRDIWYEEKGDVGYLHFAFYNGAMSTAQCERLVTAIRAAKSRPTRVLVFMGGPDYWSNGIHLNVIEAAAHPADESWANINAIDDVALEILTAGRQFTIAAMQGNAGAGGVFLALAADRVLARRAVILNPHYKGMGNLFGSEYWTYLLPRRVGADRAEAITQNRLPIDAPRAAELGLIDACGPVDAPAFTAWVRAEAEATAGSPDLAGKLEAKRARRAADEAAKPLAQYRAEELERMNLNFYGFDPSYHVARYHFVFKVPRSRTPLYLARHRAARSAVRTVTPAEGAAA